MSNQYTKKIGKDHFRAIEYCELWTSIFLFQASFTCLRPEYLILFCYFCKNYEDYTIYLIVLCIWSSIIEDILEKTVSKILPQKETQHISFQSLLSIISF